MAGDPYWSNVVLAMHMDDVGLTDLKGHAVTLNGNAARSAAQSRFGGYSAYFDGTGDYLSLADSEDWNFGAGDFTIEAWVYLNSPGAVAARVICGQQTGSVATGSFVFYFSVSGSAYTGLVLKVSNGATEAYPSASYSFSAGTLYHVAVSRASGVVRFFVNGAKVGSDISNTYAFPNSTADLRIGNWNGQTFDYTGYLDDLRITKGVARYTANFAPPNRAFSDALYTSISGTVVDNSSSPAERLVKSYRMSDGLLAGIAASNATTGAFTVDAEGSGKHFVVCQENYDPHYANVVLDMRMDDIGLTDQKGHVVTAYASAARSALASKFGGYSAKFNGTTDYLSVATSTDFDFGSGDFTIEAWVAITAEKAVDSYHAIAALGWNDVTRTSLAFFFGLLNTSGGGRELQLFLSPNGTTSGLVQSRCPAGWALGEFAHVAAVRSGAMLTLYFNGVGGSPLKAPASIFAPTAQPLYIGNGNPINTIHHYMNGYIDSLRITKGVARYTQNFFPPPLPFSSQTSPTENALIFDNITPV